MFRKAAILNSLPITISKEEPTLSEFEFITFCTRAHLILRDYVDYMSALYTLGIDVDLDKADHIPEAVDVIEDLIATSMSRAYGVKPETVKKTLDDLFYGKEWYDPNGEDVELPNYRAVFRRLTGSTERPRRAA